MMENALEAGNALVSSLEVSENAADSVYFDSEWSLLRSRGQS